MTSATPTTLLTFIVVAALCVTYRLHKRPSVKHIKGPAAPFWTGKYIMLRYRYKSAKLTMYTLQVMSVTSFTRRTSETWTSDIWKSMDWFGEWVVLSAYVYLTSTVLVIN